MTALMSALLSPAGKAVAGLALAAAVIGGAYWLGHRDGRAAGRAEQMADTLEAYRKRQGIDDDIARLDAAGLCLELGGVPDECEQLRRLEAR